MLVAGLALFVGLLFGTGAGITYERNRKNVTAFDKLWNEMEANKKKEL